MMNSTENMKSEKWDIIAKYLANEELTLEEKEILDTLKSDPDMRKIVADSQELFETTDRYFSQRIFNTDKAWNKVNNQLNTTKKRTLLSWPLRIAAAVLLLIATGITVWQFTEKNENIREYATAQNDLSLPEITLPDGTKVTLNHGSKISYPEQFTGNTREITLSGEAFFDVTHNPEKQFVITANGASVKVLGTSFNVYAYNNVSVVEVAVKTGKVELKENVSDNSNEKVLLLPGEKGVFDKTNRKVSKATISNSNNFSWFTHDIEFNYSPLSEVVSTLNRTFNVRIEADSNVDLTLPLNATFNQQKLEYIMNVVALTHDLRFEKTGDNSYTIQNNR